MSLLDEMMLKDAELSNNKSKRIPICLCIDGSASMAANGTMNKVNQGILSFLEKTDHDSLARDAADICIVSFGSDTGVLCDFGPVQSTLAQMRAVPIRATGAQTLLAQGVELALNHLERHLAQLAAVNNNAYVPWLIIISDGDSTELPSDVSRASARVQNLLRTRRLKTMCLSLGPTSSLKAFTADGVVHRLDHLKVVDFFDMLSRSISQTSRMAIENGGPQFDLT